MIFRMKVGNVAQKKRTETITLLLVDNYIRPLAFLLYFDNELNLTTKKN